MSLDLAGYVRERRWFRAKARGLAEATVAERFPLDLAGDEVALCVLALRYADGGADAYVLPIAHATGEAADRIRRERPHLAIGDEGGALAYDALGDERLLGALLERFRDGGDRVSHGDAALVFRPFAAFDATAPTSVEPRPVTTEQTNTSVVFGDGFILKVLRQLDEGVSADLEMGEYLTRHGYAGAPPVAGAIVLERAGAEPATVAILHRFVPNLGDAWGFTLRAVADAREPEAYRPYAERLGARVGEMHAVLAAGTEPAFAPRPLGESDRARLAEAVQREAEASAAWIPEGALPRIAARLAAFVHLPEAPWATRVHGDLHLGQILRIDSERAGDDAGTTDFVLIDFEGEPARPLAERKAKRAPMADVAGMLRSFHYAAATVLRADDPEAAQRWYTATAESFLAAYRAATRATAVVPQSEGAFRAVLDFYLIEKCIYEIRYEANNRPDWLDIPRGGLADLLASERDP